MFFVSGGKDQFVSSTDDKFDLCKLVLIRG